MMREERTVILHGFNNTELTRILRAVKDIVDNPTEVVFAASTPTNLDWKLKDIISDTREDHEYLRKNPPELPKN
jgi:hypothetical protein